jgi:uncharacterized protein
MRVVRASDYITRPWKNGGGTTREILTFPEGAGYDTFGWLVSAARVERPGPFSIFPDADRTMAILSGSSLSLHGLGSSPVVLTPQSEPFDFPGDVPVSATLGGEAIEDMNLMVRRGQFGHRMRRLDVGPETTITPRGTAVVFLERGAVCAVSNGQPVITLAQSDSLICMAPLVVSAQGAATLLVMEVWPI